MSSLRRNGIAFASASALAGVLSAVATSGSIRAGLLSGVIAGAVSGALSLGFVTRAAEKSVQAALVAIVSGFLIRLVLVAIALVLAKQLGGDALMCAFSFFALYAFGQAQEVAIVTARQRAQSNGVSQEQKA